MTSSGTTTTQSTQPWAGSQPYLTNLYSAAQNQYQNGSREYYPGQTYASFDPNSLAALQGTAARAIGGSPVDRAAQNNAAFTMQGGYLSPASNPWLQQTYDAAAGNVQSGVNSIFSRAGRYGSNAHQETMGRNLSDLATQIYGGNYQAERGRQMQAMQMAPGLSGLDYRDLSALQGVGDAYMRQDQNRINDAINMWNYNRDIEPQRLSQLAGLLSGAGNFSTTTGTQQQAQNPFGNMAGGALMGYGMFNNPYGALAGAGLGLLGSYF